MTYIESPVGLTNSEIIQKRLDFGADNKTVVFTNGCFDLLHRGHVEFLEYAKSLGDVLVVGLNDDVSVRRQGKGFGRPIFGLEDRAAVLLGLESVDYVCSFSEDTPQELINALVPDVLVKGSDWSLGTIVGRDTVEEAGGRVVIYPLFAGRSTTAIIKKILDDARC